MINRMGSIEFGKLANMTVFDCDFLHDDLEKVEKANIVATLVEGEEVYRGLIFVYRVVKKASRIRLSGSQRGIAHCLTTR